MHSNNYLFVFILQVYGELFLILQTSPEYIAKLARSVSQKEIDGKLHPLSNIREISSHKTHYL